MRLLRFRALLFACIIFSVSLSGFAQVVALTGATVVSDPGIPIYPGYPDGHISYFALNDSVQVQVWAGYESYIS